MLEREIESLSGPSDQSIAPQKERVKVLTSEEIRTLPLDKFEKRLDGIFGKEKPGTSLNEVINPVEQNDESSFGKRLVAAAVVGPLLFGAGVAVSPTEAKAETVVVTEGTVPSESGLEGYEISTPAPNPEPGLPTPAPTEKYAEKQRKIAGYKEDLRAHGCQEIYLEICANNLLSRKENKGFYDKDYGFPEKTEFKNFIEVSQIYEFGRTGETQEDWNFGAIYYGDGKGNKTKEAAFLYVANPENYVPDIELVQKAVDFWEKRCPGFTRWLNKMGMWTLLLSDASKKDNKVENLKYLDSILYMNYSKKNKNNDFYNFVVDGLGEEPFGIRGEALGDEFSDFFGIGSSKSYFAFTCCNNLARQMPKDKDLQRRCKKYRAEMESYIPQFWIKQGRTIGEFMDLINKVIMSENLMPPYGVENWSKIDMTSTNDIVNTIMNNAKAKVD